MSALEKKPGYHPELAPRRGEWIAWGTALLVIAAWLVLFFSGNPAPWAVKFLALALVLAAASISLSNWMDRRTQITIQAGSIHYENGLRNVTLPWESIREVRVLPAPWGKKVQVLGSGAHFNFHTLGEVKLNGEVKGRVGFVKGDEILRTIVLNAGLQISDKPGNGYYYARE